jgi:1-pyrroline-5-carboxylate dehydrogenase
MDAIQTPPPPRNEMPKSYAPGTPERDALKGELMRMLNQEIEIPMVIGGQEVKTNNRVKVAPPHDHQHALGWHHRGDSSHVQQAIDAALAAKEKWAAMPWQERAAIFLKAAELASGPYRARVNAATMLGQSKTPHQSEIEGVCEWCDFLRFNVDYMYQIYQDQPRSFEGVWNRMEYRPLEGFILAITPFNFSAIAGNLPMAPALMGNVALWKPADSQIYAAKTIMEIYQEAGLPDGVINLIYADGPDVGNTVFPHPDFAGLHFTGSYGTFTKLWQEVGNNIHRYKNFPRIVGETGGKDFIIAHPSADMQAVVTACTRGAFEFQGQKCSAASRAYIPASWFDDFLERFKQDIGQIRMGDPTDFTNFMGAVIDRPAFDKITGYIEKAKQDPDTEVLVGGNYDDTKGYFVEPTVLLAHKPDVLTMREEIFGPVITLYKYNDEEWEHALDLVDQTSPYGLTGAIFSQDRQAAYQAVQHLRQSAGNLYLNDKPTGSIVNQQPFGGARASGTNDKAGSYLNLVRWCSARVIKENFNPPHDFRYPYMEEE